jgi:hypothetical protein
MRRQADEQMDVIGLAVAFDQLTVADGAALLGEHLDLGQHRRREAPAAILREQNQMIVERVNAVVT